MAKRPRRFNARKEVRAIARERIGTVPPSKMIVSKAKKPPKHGKPLEEDSE